ncbi:hypothetical protein FM042_07500 [Aliidiomarina halalkaliphila]|uniref:Flagellar hook-length control protein-like C-terminal domain-containing protein n=1 Tax=Aliidiomarina halalkaliphila TaxID=2593535 RepID=A0A552X198_9GAMM|nr:flagellar hook-length control protein FliK [Aliidiomarina halalkaliphila]TRW48820.1 hypothetical protein FM042_07500 [Aliidiomarina halalkaliphila]
MLNLINLSTAPDLIAKDAPAAGKEKAFHALFANQQQLTEVPPRAAYPFTPQQVLAQGELESTHLPQLNESPDLAAESLALGAAPQESDVLRGQTDPHAIGQPNLKELADALERIALSQAMAVTQNTAPQDASGRAPGIDQTGMVRQPELMSGPRAEPTVAPNSALPASQQNPVQPLIAPASGPLINTTGPSEAATLPAAPKATILGAQPQAQAALASLIKDGMSVQPDSNARLTTEAARAQSLQPQVVAQNAAGQQPMPVFAGLHTQQTEMTPSAAAQWLQELQLANAQGTTANSGSGMNAQPSVQDQINLQGMSTTSAQPGAASSASISAPLASNGWQQQLGQQVLNMHLSQDQTVKLRLHPAELGPLMISMKMEEQAATMQFSSNNAQVRAAVEQAIPQLRELLAEQGIALGEADVHDGKKEQEAREFAELSSQSADTLIEDSPAEPEAIDIPLKNGQIDLYA